MTSADDSAAPSPAVASRRWWPGAVVLAVVALLPFRGLWLAPGPPMEEGFMLVFPELVLHGMVPNRDFLHLYGPGSLWVLAGVYRVFGVSLETQRAFGFVQLVGVVGGLFALLRPWGWRLAAVGACTATVVVFTPAGFTAMAWVGAVALAACSVAVLAGAVDTAGVSDARRGRRAAVAGVLAGFALLYRLDVVVAVVLSALVLVPALRPGARLRYLVGLAAGVAPFLVHVATAGIGNVWRGLVVEPVFELRGGRRLPLPPSLADYDGFLQRAGSRYAPPWPFPAPPGPPQLVLWLLALGGALVLLLAAGGIAYRRRHDRRLLAAAALALGLLPQALQRPDSTHLAWVSCVAFALLPAAVVELLPFRGVAARRAVGALAAAVPLLVMLVLVPWFTLRNYADAVARSIHGHEDVGAMRRGDRIFLYGNPFAVRAVNEMLPVVDAITDPGDRLFVGTGDLRQTAYSEAFLYYLLPELVPATRYIEMDPGVANAEDSGLADEVASADVVILSSIRDDWNEPNDSLRFGPEEPNLVLARDFCQVGSYGEGLFDRGLYVLYERCRPRS